MNQALLVRTERGGCLGALAIAFVVIVVLCVIAVGVSLWLGSKFFGGLIDEWTDTTPMEVPEARLSSNERADTLRRTKEFVAALKSGTAAAPLVLSGDEINALLTEIPEWNKFPGKVFVEIKDGAIGGMVSMPMDDIGFAGRYINGKAKITVSLQDDFLVIRLRELEVKGNKVPEEVLAQLAQANLAEDAYKDPDNRKILQQIKSIEVEGDRLIITPKSGAVVLEFPRRIERMAA